MKKHPLRLMAEQFLQSIETKFQYALKERSITAEKRIAQLIKEAEESPEMEHQINPESNTGRMQVIDFLLDPGKYDKPQIVPANQKRARAIAEAIIKQGQYARLMSPKNSGKVPVRYDTLIGAKGKDTIEQTNQRTQDYDLAIEMLVAAYNTPNGQETPFQLGTASSQMKEQIKQGITVMFNMFDDATGDPGIFLKFIYGDRYNSPNPGSLPKIPTKLVNGVEMKDTMAMRDQAYEAYGHLIKQIDKILRRPVDPSGVDLKSQKWSKTSAYVTTTVRNKMITDFKNARKNRFSDVDIDSGVVDKELSTGPGGESLFDLSKMGDLGIQALKDIRDELINWDPNKYKEFFGDSSDGARMPKPKDYHIEALSLIIDSLEGSVVHTDAQGKEYMGGQYKTLAEFSRDIFQNPPTQYPALSQFIKTKNSAKAVQENLDSFFKSKVFELAKDYMRKTKYAKLMNPNADDVKFGATNPGGLFGSERQEKSDRWKKSSSEDEEELEIDGKKQSDWDADDYAKYYATLEEEKEFMEQLSESVNRRIFDYVIKTAIYG